MHTARPHRGTGITGNLINMFIYGVDDGDNSRIRMGLGIGCIQSIDIRKKDEQIGIDETTDHSRQRIVIANFISFSLIIGMMPISNIVSSVLREFMNLLRSWESIRVSSTWPTIWPYSRNIIS
jgi:hypothetical protein